MARWVRWLKARPIALPIVAIFAVVIALYLDSEREPANTVRSLEAASPTARSSAVKETPGTVDTVPQSVVVKAAVEVETIVAYAEPDAGAKRVANFSNNPEFPLHFLAVVDSAGYAQQLQAEEGDSGWLEVLLPIRPNGSTGWIQTAGHEILGNPFRIEIDVSEHRLEVYDGEQRWLVTEIAVGTGETPTPIGSFYTTELYDVPNPNGVYGPHAFALSGFSETLEKFRGGEAIIGIHGTNEPTSIGKNVSHGCIRVENDVITDMAELLPLGTPVVIEA